VAASIDDVIRRIETSGILDDADLAVVRNDAAEANGNAQKFVRLLVKNERLTAYQAQAIWKDKGHKLAFGNYIIEDELGRGGMGVVLKARHKRMQRTVGIKVLPAKFTEDPEAIARFQREVVAASQLLHTNIVSAFDADEIAGQHILVMEFVDGRDLSAVVKKQGPFGVEQAIDCILQAARGLEFAHKRGVIHRDIKPANLLLDSEGTVKILDMGLARFSDSADVGTQAELTGTGTVMGTVDYMSPEQAMSTKSADARADQYSLGITLYYLLTGNPAYTGDTLMARLMAHANSPIPSLADERPDLPDGLQEAFATMVAKQPDDRYPSMTEVIAALEACRSGGSSTAVVATAPVTGDESEGGLTNILNAESINIGAPTVAHVESGPDDDATGSAGTATRKKTRRKNKATVAAASEEETVIGAVDVVTSRTLPPRALGSAKSKSSSRPPWTDRRVLAGAGSAALLLLAAFFFFRGPDGSTLRVEIDDPDIEVSIKGTDIVFTNADKQPITVTPGKKILHVTRGDFAFFTDTLILKKGETVVVRAELLDGEVQIVRDENVIGRSGDDSKVAAGGTERALPPDSNAVVTPEKGPVDLLTLLDESKDAIAGNWTRDGDGTWRSDATPKSRIQIPVAVKGNYRLKARLVRLTANKPLVVVLPVGTKQFCLTLSDGEEKISGIGRLQDKDHTENETMSSDAELLNGDLYDLDVSLSTNGETAQIRASLDGERFLNWFGPVSALSLDQAYLLPREDTIALASDEAEIQFRRVTLEMQSGYAEPLREEDFSKLKPTPREEWPSNIRPEAGWVDVMPLIDGKLDAVDAAWERSGEELKNTGPGYFFKIRVPIRVQGSYELRLQYTVAPQRPNFIGLGLPMGAIRAEHGLQGETGEKQTVVVTVDPRTGKVETTRNGMAEVSRQVQVDHANSAMTSYFINLGAADEPLLITRKGYVTFHTVEFRMLDGFASLVRPDDARKLKSVEPAGLSMNQPPTADETVSDRPVAE
jgi:serine/threonine protein kinase